MKTLVCFLLLTVAVLGVLLYLQTVALRNERRQVQELTGKKANLDLQEKKAGLDLQEKCAKRASEINNELSTLSETHGAFFFSNHYNERLNKCFVLRENLDSRTVPETFPTHRVRL